MSTAISVQSLFLPATETAALPVWLVSESTLEAWRAAQLPDVVQWMNACGFKADRNKFVVLPGQGGAVAGVVIGIGRLENLDDLTLWHTAGLAERLPVGDYCLATSLSPSAATQAALGFAYGHYRFQRYRSFAATKEAKKTARLVPPRGCDLNYVQRAVQALFWARDLINTPAGDMGPAELAAEARQMSERHGAQSRVIEGAALLEEGYPAIHAVGRASARAPRLIDIRWGSEQHPRVTLVGKGVCFDTGGLDLKNSAGMLLMKKDMGGAACALALAQMVMDAKLPVRLRVLIPAVENCVSGDAFRPGDVLQTRKGITVEVGNTDAEGRLVLCDALAEADRERPDLLVDMATLTGAARVALGPELPPLYGNRQELVDALMRHSRAQFDPLWPMPLWQPYEDDLSSKIADTNNVAGHAFAGSVLAALFLRRFVSDTTPWLHLDVYAWNAKDRAGRPVGGEVQGVRAVFALLKEKFADHE